MYTSVEQLKKDIEVFKKELASKFDGTDGKKYLQLCGGTGCLAANTMGIKEKFDELIEKNGMQDKVECRVSGCLLRACMITRSIRSRRGSLFTVVMRSSPQTSEKLWQSAAIRDF